MNYNFNKNSLEYQLNNPLFSKNSSNDIFVNRCMCICDGCRYAPLKNPDGEVCSGCGETNDEMS